jgi:hypothetical protein
MPTLVLVHIGEQWPHYLEDCIHQARLLNPVVTTDIYLAVNIRHQIRVLSLESKYKIKTVFLEDLQQSEKHKEFLERIVNMVDLQFRKQYWQYVFERFFILEELCKQHSLHSVYMMETDNMLYVPLQIVETTEKLFSQGMAAPFDNLEQGYPSIVFFRNQTAVTDFCNFMICILRIAYLSDMKILGLYRRHHPEKVFPYPVLPHSCNTPLRKRKSTLGHTASEEESAFLSHADFPIIFDAIAYGQAVGGIDPRNISSIPTVGFVNESALYSIRETEFGWMKFHSYWLPVVNGIPLVNLHIHSKALSSFLSDREKIPQAQYNPKELEEKLQSDLNTST